MHGQRKRSNKEMNLTLLILITPNVYFVVLMDKIKSSGVCEMTGLRGTALWHGHGLLGSIARRFR
ncbi:hypothetical protein M440DRAFT_1155888 [Trichoderma longibrachiatum ATCC 18648]|uniref:Uncharacterized protein n=1 Tax=Trichoderma longibrachiatum ATCC 18648 TaxID=983965 RepID=A0A2T4BP40_TRILO|nr:hypothetical protein M440DRAFT_1155888 [Trichoderma longibrachiatum ATCC 18648]